VALYGGRRRWAMTERGRARVSRDAHNFVVGPSALLWTGAHLEIRIDEINLPWPVRVRGVVRVYPEGLSRYVTALDDQGLHRWGPIAPCARVEAHFDRPDLDWKGAAYFDSNEGDEPIDRPFTDWDWARARLADGSTGVIYDVRQKRGADRLLALRFDRHGEARAFEPPPRQPLPASLWRVARSMRSDAGVAPRVVDTLEDAPFYVRSVVQSGMLGERVTAFHETLNAPRLASRWVKMLLPFRMPRTP
jgi:carotenoid 1,2-hydratase